MGVITARVSHFLSPVYGIQMIELVIAVIAVVVISAMCSLFEAVLLSSPLSHVEKLAQDENKSGQIFRSLRRSVDRPLSAILSLNTIANTGGAAIAGAAFLRVYGSEDSHDIYFQILLTLAVLFLSEVIPKTVGAVYSRQLTTWVARPLYALVFLLRPLIALTGLATRLVSKGSDQGQDISGEDLQSLARLGASTGAIEDDEAKVIHNILSLKEKEAREVMTPRTVVFALPETATVEAARQESGTWAHSRIPVYADEFEDIVGIVLRRDILAALARDRDQVQLSVLMRPVHFVSESTDLDRILDMFLEKRQHMFVVIDEYAGLAGVLTLEDVLEEILGQQIVDELDQVEDMRELARRRRQQTIKGEDPDTV
ncbi:MAG: hemolysin family protein [Candidatus Latescibacterota bacterium]|nr:hemolysin family protein [Candidatus Latescibacterota bacterium]